MGSLGEFLDAYIASRTDVKDGTQDKFSTGEDNLVAFFGTDRPLEDVCPGDADDFRRWLKGELKLGVNTIRKALPTSETVLPRGCPQASTEENPFGDMKDCSVKGNKARQFFITLDTARAVLDVMVDQADKPLPQWQLIFALWPGLVPFGALPNISLLTWQDVDFEQGKLTFDSPKTERTKGRKRGSCRCFRSCGPIWKQRSTRPKKNLAGRPRRQSTWWHPGIVERERISVPS
jgi:hypothetical protein